MRKKLAEFISFLFHPVWFSLLVPFLIVYRHTLNFGYSLKWMLFSGLFLVLALVLFFVARPAEFFTDFDISQREKRVRFYALSLLIVILYFFASLRFKGIFFPLSLLSLGIIIGIIFIEIVNMFIKVSIHVAVISAFVLMIMFLYGIGTLWGTFFLLPLVIWSRLTLKKHTGLEAFVGILIGSTITLLTLAIVLLLT